MHNVYGWSTGFGVSVCGAKDIVYTMKLNFLLWFSRGKVMVFDIFFYRLGGNQLNRFLKEVDE